MVNRFFERAWEGSRHPLFWLLTATLVFIAWAFVGGLPFLAVLVIAYAGDLSGMISYLVDPYDFGSIPVPFLITFSAIMMQFVIGVAAAWLFGKWIQRRSFSSFITAGPRFRWKRYWGIFGLIMLINIIYAGVDFYLRPDAYNFHFSPQTYFPFFFVALVLLPFQTGFEEIFFRGILLQGFGQLMPNHRWVSVLITSAGFALMHILNPETANGGFWVAMMFYFSFGLVMALLTVADEGIELAAGFHLANNFFAFAFMGYQGQVIETPSLLVRIPTFEWMDLALFAASVVLVVLLFVRKRMGHIAALFQPRYVPQPEIPPSPFTEPEAKP